MLLLEQNRALWDHLLIRRGLAALERAEELGGADGPYALQAAIAACHARAATAAETDWARIAALYATLASLAPSPVVELNRAVALAMAYGPQAGLDLADTLTGEPGVRARRRAHPPRPRTRAPARSRRRLRDRTGIAGPPAAPCHAGLRGRRLDRINAR